MAVNKPVRRSPPPPNVWRAKRPFPVAGCIAAASIVIAVSLAVWMFLGRSTPDAPSEDPPKKAAKVKKAKPVLEKKDRKVASPRPDKVQPTNAVAQAKAAEEYVKRPGQLQLPSGKVLTFPAPAEGEVRKVYADGRMYECDHLGNFKDITPRKLFHTAFEANFLGLALEDKPYIPAFLTGLDEAEVKKMLEKKYQPIGDETEEELVKLKAYNDMRHAVLAYMEQGGRFDDFVNEYAAFDRKQRESRALCLGEVMKLYKAGRVREARDMAEAASVMMDQKGYKPIRLPEHVRAEFDALPKQ